MQETPGQFETYINPESTLFGETPLDFLKNLSAPAWIIIDGIDNSRQRAIVTLLHGNEPSGLKAVHTLLTSGRRPATRLGIFVASVNAALFPPMLSHRFLPLECDLNRCFGENFVESTNQHKLAASLLKTLKQFQPEAVIDTHNTSAHSQPFAVAIRDDMRIRQLATLFTNKLIVFDQYLGTLMEQPIGAPIVTVEFGAFGDTEVDQLAETCLSQFIYRIDLFEKEPNNLQTLLHPLRLEIAANAKLNYAASVQDPATTTVFNTIDQLNFKTLAPGTSLGWLGPEGLATFSLVDKAGNDRCEELLMEQSGFLQTREEVTVFMATTDSHIAKKDCLMYLCPKLERPN